MPIPAGTGLTRRSVLLRSAGLALAVYGAGKTLTPQAFEAAVAEAAGEHRVLVSIFMDGGADALSLLAPVNDARYVALRPTLRMLPGAGTTFEADTRLHVAPVRAGPARAVGRPGRRRRRRAGDRLRLAEPVALHLAPLLGGRRHRSRPPRPAGSGATSIASAASNVPIQGLSLDGSLSPQLATSTVAVAATNNISDYQFQARGVWGTMQTRMRTTLRPARRRRLGRPDPRAGPPGAVQRGAALERPRVGRQRRAAGRARTTRPRTPASRRGCRPSPGCSARRAPPATTCPCAA